LLVTAVAMGAARAVGVDYASAAVELARQTIGVHGMEDRAEAHLADARGAPVDTASADLVTLLDVVEHLAPAELDDVLFEARRVLRPGGRVFVHTFPTRTVYDVTYRLQRWACPRRRRAWLADPRDEHERLLHVNEQTRRSLRGVLRRAGFEPVRVWPGQWIHTDFVPEERARRLYHLLARHRLTASLGIANLFALAWRPT
jgi:ubiquinone/menaquinone biosynthesis C-methylase UbiE